MIGCMLCDTPARPQRASVCPPEGCLTVVLRLRVVSETVPPAKEVQGCFQSAGLRQIHAKHMAEQLSDLGVAEVVLPRVKNLDALLQKLAALSVEAKTVQALAVL